MVLLRLVRCPRPSDRRTTPASVHQVAYRHQLEARMAVVRGNTLESGYMLLVPHTTALAEAEPVTVHAAAGPTRTTGESSLLRIFSISLEPSFSHGPTLANGRHIGFGGIHWDFSALFPQRYHTSAITLNCRATPRASDRRSGIGRAT